MKVHIIEAKYNISLKLYCSATMLLVGSGFTNMDLAQRMVLTWFAILFLRSMFLV